jgi:hypothetical protein
MQCSLSPNEIYMSLTDALLLEIAKLDSKLRHAIQICSQY